jgi:hypothetical protein
MQKRGRDLVSFFGQPKAQKVAEDSALQSVKKVRTVPRFTFYDKAVESAVDSASP